MFTLTIWSLIAIALLVRTRSDADLSEAERRTAPLVSTDPDVSFTESTCFRNFFLMKNPPRNLEIATTSNISYICQRRDTTSHQYASLFDTAAGIPVYSGYVISRPQGLRIGTHKRLSVSWEKTPGIGPPGIEYLYSGSSAADIQRGHLNPWQINTYNEIYMKATFIYTNCVPQCGRSFNSGSWMAFEERIAAYTKNRCANQTGGTMYLVTGQSHYGIRVRSDGSLAQVPTPIQYFPAAGSASTVHVVQPNSLWTAGCCVTISTTTGAITTAESIAVIGNNDRNSSCTLTGRVDLRDLERLIVSNTSTPANIFPGFPDGCRNNSYSANL
ncbi:uncharacterized protein [Montipora foliosa]|uniref:uncharacterized protein n=1 Tax=Montipora foliosa TaxID=591990 RepID=UPI0035F20279